MFFRHHSLYINALSMHFFLCTILKALLQLPNSCTSTTQPIIWPVVLAMFLSTNLRTSLPEGCLLHLMYSGFCGTKFIDSRLRPKAITHYSLTVTKCYFAICSASHTPLLLTLVTLVILGISSHHLPARFLTEHPKLSQKYQLTSIPPLICFGTL